MGTVAARRQPRTHVVAVVGSKGQQQHELLVLLPGQAHDGVVRLHLALFLVHRADRDAQQVLLVVEDLRVLHVVGGVHLRLHLEKVLRIADVGEQRVGHGRYRLEQARKPAGVSLDHGVVGIGDVEVHRAVVGIHHGLHRVAHVVADALGGLGVRIAVGCGVAVDDPEEASLRRHHQVGVLVEVEERRQLPHPVVNPAVVEDAALRGEVVRQRDAQGRETRREQELAPERAQRNAALALVGRVDVLVAGRVIELARLGVHEHVVVGHFAEVDPRALHLDEAVGYRRDVLDEKLRQPLLADLVHRAEDDAVSVGVDQVLVDPDAARELLVGQFPRRQHHLPVVAVDLVAVGVHVHELVVGADLLELRVGGKQRLVVPQPDVLDGAVVLLQVFRRQHFVHREFLGLHPVEAVGMPGRAYVAFDVGRLRHQLVGNHVELLQKRRIGVHPDGVYRRQGAEPDEQEPQPRPAHLHQTQH